MYSALALAMYGPVWVWYEIVDPMVRNNSLQSYSTTYLCSFLYSSDIKMLLNLSNFYFTILELATEYKG